MLKVEKLVVGDLGANCYVVGDEKEVLVVDPGGDAPKIIQAIGNRKLTYILLTHVHIDHVEALEPLKTRFPEAQLVVHEIDAPALKNTSSNLSVFLGTLFIYKNPPEILVKDGDTFPFLDAQIRVFHTPGHTPGGCCYLLNEHLFSGDTLFKYSIGRTDFPGGSYEQIIQSIREKLFLLPEETKVYPGHMEKTTIKSEKNGNPFLQ